MKRRTRWGTALAAAALATTCGGEPEGDGGTAGLPDTAHSEQRAATGDTPGTDVRVEAAEALVAFLRGEGPFEAAPLGDSLTLRVAPEGGGGSATLPREALRDSAAWRVTSPDGRVHSLLPFDGPAETTARAGRHFRCFEGDLAEAAPALAGRPHVGVLLRAEDGAEPASCLGTWSLTVVFAEGAGSPRATDVVYDQWEW